MTAIQRAAFLAESRRLDSVMALAVAKGVSIAHSGSPEDWRDLVAHAHNSPLRGDIQEYRAKVARAKSEVGANRGAA